MMNSSSTLKTHICNIILVGKLTEFEDTFIKASQHYNCTLHMVSDIEKITKHLNKNKYNLAFISEDSSYLSKLIECSEKAVLQGIIIIKQEKDSPLKTYNTNILLDDLWLPLSKEKLLSKIQSITQTCQLLENRPSSELNQLKAQSPIAVIDIDQKDIIVECNTVFSKIIEQEKNHVIGSSISYYLEYETLNKSSWHKFFSDKNFDEDDVFKVKTKTEKLLYLKFTSCYKNTDHLTLFVQDFTELVQKKKEIQTYRNVVDKTFLVSIFSEDGTILYVNKNQLNTCKHTREYVLGKKINETYLIDNKDFKAIKHNIQSHKMWIGETKNLCANKEQYWTLDIIIPYNNKAFGGSAFLLIRVDITDSKNAEKALKTKTIMEKSLKLKNDFLSNISHEIRTPLNSIMGFTDLLLETPTNNLQDNYLEIIKKSGSLLLTTINDILDLTKIEDGKLNLKFKPFNLEKTVNEVLSILKFDAEIKGLQLEYKFINLSQEDLIGDQKRLQQILVNIIKNAIKFTKVGSIKVKVKKIAENKERAKYQFDITDTGRGVKKEKQLLLFEAFTQSEDYLSREYDGLGVGLTIVKKLIKAFNGDINFISEENQGTNVQFSISFDINQNPVEDIPKISKSQIKVLLAEDNENNQILATTRLQNWGFRVEVANNGLEVLEKLKHKDYDIILMDLQMPFLDGYVTTQEIRTNFPEHKANIPIIALTAHASNGNIEKSKIIGMNDYIYKPFKAKELHDKILQVIAKNKTSTAPKKSYNIKEVFYCQVSYDYLQQECLGNNRIIKLYIHSFIKEFEDFIDKCSYYASKLDYQNIYKTAHKILPSVKTFSLVEIINLVEHIHDNSKNNKKIEYEHILAEITNYYASVKGQLNEKLSQL